MPNNMTFKQFIEFSDPKPVTHFKALSGELGIEPEDVAKVPQVASFFNLGNNTYNLSGIKIIDYEYDDQGNPTHARITMINDPHSRTRKTFRKHGDKYVQMDDEPDDKIYMVPIKQLEKLMTQGLDQAGAGAMGPPGMGGGMGGGMGMM